MVTESVKVQSSTLSNRHMVLFGHFFEQSYDTLLKCKAFSKGLKLALTVERYLEGDSP